MQNKTFWICISIWTIITFLRMFFHQPWLDESNAWEIAKNLQFGSILSSLKYEGHFLGWFLILMPFAKLNLGYPYSMLFINWIFCFAAVILLWKYSPFNNWIKTLITFSFPFFTLYPVVARCYTIGILLIFILMSLYKYRLKYAVLYSILICICANTSLMAAIGCFSLGLILIYDLIKQRQYKDLGICTGIFAICLLTLIIQVMGVSTEMLPKDEIPVLSLNWLLNPFIFGKIINSILLVFFILGFGIILLKNKKAFWFISSSYLMLFIFFQFIYAGNFWHYYFFYIYLICACWIFTQNQTNKYLTILLCILSFLFVLDYRLDISVYQSHSGTIAKYIKEKPDANYIFLSKVFLSTIPYLDKTDNISMYNSENGNYDIIIDFDEIQKIYNYTKQNYMFINTCAPISNLKKDNKIMKFILAKNIQNLYCIYNIIID